MDFLDQVESLHSTLVKDILDNLPQESPILYHYTTLENAFKIIDSGKLRFTNIRYLNDPNELQEGIEIAEEIFNEVTKEFSRRSKRKIEELLFVLRIMILLSFTTYTERKGKLEQYKSDYRKKFSSDIPAYLQPALLIEKNLYICCFSERDDDLRQWLPYANETKGVSLGFEEIRNNYHNLTIQDLSIIRVCYLKNDKKKKFLKKFLFDVFEYAENSSTFLADYATDETSIATLAAFMSKLNELLIADLVACKNEHYCDEVEWRLYFLTSNDTKNDDEQKIDFYIKNNIMKPCIDIDINLDALKHIKLGSLCNWELNGNSLKMLLRKKNYSHVSVEQSKINYRG